MDNTNQYSVVVLPKEAWEEIVKTLGELKAKVDGLSVQREDEWLNSKAIREYLGISSRQFQKYRDERRIPFSQFWGLCEASPFQVIPYFCILK